MTSVSQTFRTKPGGNDVGIEVPERVVAGFGAGKRVPLVGTIDRGYRYRTRSLSARMLRPCWGAKSLATRARRVAKTLDTFIVGDLVDN